MFEMSNTYWYRNGMYQGEYEEMQDAQFQYTKATEKVIRTYYRYYNDGDLPRWTRTRWYLTQAGKFGRELNEEGQEVLEWRVDEALAREYKRFCKQKAC